jgi:hypothetical protein
MSAFGVRQVVFIDSRVPDIQDLLNGLQPGEQAFVLDPSSDGVQQIADILAANNFSGLASISIVGHGAAGQIELGSTELDDSNLSSHSAALAKIGAALAPGSDLLLYGCDIASGATGQQFIADLATFADGADVAAATHAVGSADLGGSWTLDASTGPIEAGNPFTDAALANFEGVLANPLTGQLWYVTQGGTTDARISYINADGSNPTTLVNGPTNVGTGFPTQISLDAPANLYFEIASGGPGGGSGSKLLFGHIDSAAAPTVAISYLATQLVFGLEVDPIHEHIYVGVVNSSGAAATSGILDYTYNPATGAITPVATNGGFLVTQSQAAIPSALFAARDFALDLTQNELYFTNLAIGAGFESNEVYHLDLSNPTVVQRLVPQAQFPTDFSNGYIIDVEVDHSRGLVYFDTESNQPATFPGFNAALNNIWVTSTSNNGTTNATVLALSGAGFNAATFFPGDMSFDQSAHRLYVESEEGPDTVGTDDLIYVFDLASNGLSATLSYTIHPGLTQNDSNIGGMTFDILPVLPALSATTTHPAEQSTAVTLITAAPTITDADNDHLASATVKITGGTFSSNENSTADDHLTLVGISNSAATWATDVTAASGASIHVTWTGSTETLKLSGYATLSDYQTLLSQVQYFTTGDNPTNYGNNTFRTLTWQVNDGEGGDPTGTDNFKTTTVNIDAKNDAPVNHLPATPSVNEDVQTAITGISITDVDADPANQDITVTFSVLHGTLNVNTAVAGGVTGADITGGAQNTNTITLTATQNQINATIAGNGLRYTSDLNFNSGFATETLHIVTNDNSHTDSAAFPGAQTDTDDLTITVNAVNDNPNLQPDTTTPVSYIENAAPIALFAGENVDTPLGDVDQPANYSGGSIDLNITAGAVTGDRISLTGATFHISGGNVQDSGNVNIGAISGNGTSHVTVSALTSAATPSVVDALIQSFGFDSTSDNPGAGDRTITLTFNDGGNTGSGGALTDAVTQTEHVTPVNDAPVATITPTTYSATEQVALSLKNNGLAVSDVDGNSGSETVTLSVTEGILNVTTGGSGAGVAGSGTNSVTITGTIAQINALLNTDGTSTVSYNDNTDTPSASATLTLTIHDNGNTGGGDLSANDTASINITAVNDTPNAVLGTDPYAATENVALDIKNTGMSVSDVDALGAAEVATLSVTQGVLDITAGTSGVTVGTNGTSSVTLTGTLAQINALLNSDGTSTVSYTETNENPAATVTLTLQINDQGNTGTGGALTGIDTSTIGITAVNDPPVSTITPTSYSATEQVNLSLKANGLAVSDVDGNSGSETVTLSVTEGILNVTTGGSGAGVAGSGTNSVTMTGTLAQINALLNTDGTSTVSYNDNTDTPAASATLTLTIHDNGNTGGGDLSASDTATINITAVNDAPNASMTTDPYAATEQTTLSLKNTGMSVSDIDSLGASETVTLSVGEGALHVVAGGSGAGVSGDNTNSVTLTGTLAQINALLNTDGTSVVSYIDNSDNPSASNTLTLQVNDGGNTGTGGSLIGTDTSTINITAVNDAPVAAITPTEYDGSPNVAINLKNNGLSVSDVDGNSGSETVTLSVTSGTFTVTTGGSGAGVAGNGTSLVTITGTTAQINALLNTDGTSTVSFVDAVGGTKTLTLLIHDNGNTGGGDLNAQDTASIVLDNPPVVDLNGATAGTGSTLSYTENAAASAIAPTGTATDTDSADFNGGSLTVHFSANGAAEDQLSILTDGTVTVSSGTVSVGGLAIGTVSGGANGTDLLVSFNTTDATPSSVSTLIEHIGYANNSDNPSTASRSVTFLVDDGDGASGSAVATVNITAVNDGPSATITPASYSATEQTSLDLKNTGLSVSDVDGRAGSETVTLAVTEGILNITAGSSGAIVDSGNGTSSVTFHGTLAQLNALLNTDGTSTVGYIDNIDDPSATGQLTLQINDNGNTGGGSLIGSDTAFINITTVNDAPALTNVPATADYTENAGPVTFSAPFPNQIFITDPDPVPYGAPGGNGLALSATVKITSGFVAGDQLVVFDTTTATSATSGFYTGINIQWNYDATTHILTLTSADQPPTGDTLIDFAHVLQNIQFVSTSDNPDNFGANPTRTLAWQVQDAGGTANGGTDLSVVQNTTLTVHAVNDAPVVDLNGAGAGTSATLAYTENDAATAIAPSAVTTDVDSTNFNGGSLTVHFSANGAAEDQLSILATGGVTVAANVVSVGGNVVGTFSGGANGTDLVFSFNSNNATPAAITTLLEHIGYADNSENPSTAPRGVLFTLVDGDGGTNTGTATATINVTSVNDTPAFSGLDNTPTFVENGVPVVLDNNATVTDAELAAFNNFDGATLTLARLSPGAPNFDDSFGGSGSLSFGEVNVTIGATTVGSYTQQDGALTITFNASATQSVVNSVLQQLTYSNSNDNPPASVDVGYTFSDSNAGAQGPGGPLSATGHIVVGITPTNDPPVLFNVATVGVYQPGTAGSVLSPSLAVSDPDGPPAPPSDALIAGATVKIASGFFTGDVLAVDTSVTTGITALYNSGTHTLTLSGTKSTTDYQLVLETLTFSSTSPDPGNGGANPTRTIEWQVTDTLGATSVVTPDQNTTTVHFAFAPTVDLDLSAPGKDYATSYTENGAPVAVSDTDISVTDPDSATLSFAVVTLTNAQAGDFLSVSGALPGGIAATIDTTSTPGQISVSLNGDATPGDYQTAIHQVVFGSTSDNPDTTPRDITVFASDGELVGNTAHTTVTLVAVNDAPVLNANGGSLAYTENQAAAAIDTVLTVSDVDNTTLASATVSISGNFQSGQDVLGFANQNGISGSYNAATGVLTLSGVSSVANYQAALRAVSYFNSSDNPSGATRTISYQADDGQAQNHASTVATASVTVTPVNDAPVLNANAGSLAYTENQAASAIDTALTVSDVDNTTLASATVSISGNFQSGQDVLGFANQNGISGSYNSATGVLTLSGTASVANYQAALRSVSYFNSSDTPSGATRTVSYRVNDGAGANNLSNIVAASVTVTPVNDPPVIDSNGGGDTATVAVPENSTAVTTVHATDLDSPTLAYAIVGGADQALFQIDPSTGFLAFKAAPDFEHPADSDLNNSYIVQVRASDGVLADTQTITVNVTDVAESATIARPIDLNLDGFDDLVWRNVDGSVSTWVSTGGHVVAPLAPLGSAPLSTTIEGTGDFNGDGRGDVLFRSADGVVTEWLINGNHIDTIADIGSTDASWHIQGTGDFNGDHTDDILFRNDLGQVVTWSMQSGHIASIQTAGSTDPTSHIQSTGDFNGDGSTDVLFRSDDGHVATWLMNNGQVSSIVAIGTAPASAHIAGTGDFNGDGQTDILFRSDDGHVTAWLMNGGHLASVQDVGGTADASWHIQGTGDFNNDGREDILWHNDDGHSTAVWFLNNAHLSSILDIGGTPVTTHIGGTPFDLV